MVQIPGYDNRFKRIDFPELGDGVYVTLRNPKTLPPSKMQPEGIQLNSDGNPVNEEDAERAMLAVIARLVRDWHVYDASSDEDDQPLLTLPATVESMECLPLEILKRLGEEIRLAVNPS